MEPFRWKVRVNYRLAPFVDDLLEKKVLVLDDGFVSREVARALSSLRRDKVLTVGYDPKLKKSILVVDKIRKKQKKRNGFGSFVFEIL
mgnify:CR=1 FL=1